MEFFPPFKEFEKNIRLKKNQVIHTKFSADLDTPVSLMVKLDSQKSNSFLLESVTGGKIKGRFSIIGIKPDLIWRYCQDFPEINRQALYHTNLFRKAGTSVLSSLREIIKESTIDIPDNLPSMCAGLFGYLGYEMIQLTEKIPAAKTNALNLPESIFFRPSIIIIMDNVKGEVTVVTPIWCESIEVTSCSPRECYNNATNSLSSILKIIFSHSSPYKFPMKSDKPNTLGRKPRSNVTKSEFLTKVKKAINYVRSGDILQVVLSQRWKLKFDNDPFSFYRALRKTNPSPYMFFFNFENFQVVGASPEILVKVTEGKVTIRPIAGTRPRGKNLAEDLILEKDLLADPKEQAEHLMLLDLGRNDVGKVSEIGTVKPTEKFVVEKYSHVMHIVSNVEGMLRSDKDNISALFSGLPAGTVSGAPKIRAMEIISELEKEKRGVYAGGVGYFGASGEMDICIALRTAVIKEKRIYIQAGAGIVYDSIPENEYMETINKAKALFEAVEIAENEFRN